LKQSMIAETGLAAKARDLETIRTAIVDAAGVSAGLWLSYLFALFYFLVAVGGITHKDLFFESPVKLPFLNVDLPMRGFFSLGPVIFLIVHTYVLLHFRLLAGKIRVFDSELRAQIEPEQEDSDTRARLRRQLPNDAFVQFLAGPREVREGVVGLLLKLTAWISLVIGPVALLVFFQLQFLPYHDVGITWWQRIAVLLDITILWLLWPAVVRSTAEPGIRRWTRFVSGGVISLVPLFMVFLVATFPGEWLDEEFPWIPLRKMLVAGDPDTEARRPTSIWSNRLVLPNFDVIDYVKLDTKEKLDFLPVTASLRKRDLRGAVFIDANLSKADFTASDLRGAQLGGAHLENTVFDAANMDAVSLISAHLDGAKFNGTHMYGAVFDSAYMQGVILNGLDLQLASFKGAQLQNASFRAAQLQGALFDDAHLEHAVLDNAQLQGASLNRSFLEGASLTGARLEGANLGSSGLQPSASTAHGNRTFVICMGNGGGKPDECTGSGVITYSCDQYSNIGGGGPPTAPALGSRLCGFTENGQQKVAPYTFTHVFSRGGGQCGWTRFNVVCSYP
jgi:uncharacterized protein YjbI with pentapeptide repeats